jgi:hypothetical protein
LKRLAPKPPPLAIAAIAAVSAGALLGCGGDDNGTTGTAASTGSTTTGKQATTTGKQATTTGKQTGQPSGGTTTTGTMGKGGSKVAPVVERLKGKVKGGGKARDVLPVASDDSVGLIAKIANASKRPLVRVVIPRGPASEITVALGPLKGDPVSSLTLRATEGRFEVKRLRWPCALPPYTFCPIQTVESKDSYTLRMVTGKDGKIAIKLDLKPEQKPQPAGSG